jgi:hypothetical protein
MVELVVTPSKYKSVLLASRQMDSDILALINMVLRIYGLLLLIGLGGGYLITQV